MHVQRLLTSRVPPSASRRYTAGQQVFVFREKDMKYEGPFHIMEVSNDAQRVRLDLPYSGSGARPSGWFNGDQVRPVPEVADVLMLQSFHSTRAYGSAKSRSKVPPPRAMQASGINHGSFPLNV